MCPSVRGVPPPLSGARGTQLPGVTSGCSAAAEVRMDAGNESLVCKFNTVSPLRGKP